MNNSESSTLEIDGNQVRDRSLDGGKPSIVHDRPDVTYTYNPETGIIEVTKGRRQAIVDIGAHGYNIGTGVALGIDEIEADEAAERLKAAQLEA